MKKAQKDFTGGMDLKSSDINLDPTSYRYLINGRVRFGSPIPIQDSVLINAPRGNKQGLYAVNNILVLFNSGLAYYQVLGTNQWIIIPGFSMDVGVTYIYAYPVTSSTMNNARKLNASGDATQGVSIQANFTIAGTPAGLLCQDGINQPWIIFYDPDSNTARARLTKTYDQWINTSADPTIADGREYVPIGTLMFSFGSILFILSTDGFTIYRSVSGRPLDFMVNIDTNGDKLATEDLGGARSTSFACSAEQVTYIGPLDASDILVGTILNQFQVSLDTTDTIFGEPTFNTPVFLPTGIVNQFSVTDILSDYAFIDFDGPKIIGGVQQLKFAGRNDPFYLKISSILQDNTDPAFKPILQTQVAAITFNDYAIFSINTNIGYLLAVYDCLPNEILTNKFDYSISARGKWVSLDITSCIGVKMFAVSNDLNNNRLFAITTSGQVYELFASANSTTAQLRTGTITNQDVQNKSMSLGVRAVFEGIVAGGQSQVIEFIDDKRGQISPGQLTDYGAGIQMPMYFPIGFDSQKDINNIYYNLREGEEGYKLSYVISWNGSAKLLNLQLETTDIGTKTAKEQIGATS